VQLSHLRLSCYRGLFDIKKKKEESARICKRTVKERVHKTLEVTIDFTSILCEKKKTERKE